MKQFNDFLKTAVPLISKPKISKPYSSEESKHSTIKEKKPKMNPVKNKAPKISKSPVITRPPKQKKDNRAMHKHKVQFPDNPNR